MARSGASPDNSASRPRAGEDHQHFGYWIDRAASRARCYDCGFQFAGTEGTAEDWER